MFLERKKSTSSLFKSSQLFLKLNFNGLIWRIDQNQLFKNFDKLNFFSKKSNSLVNPFTHSIRLQTFYPRASESKPSDLSVYKDSLQGDQPNFYARILNEGWHFNFSQKRRKILIDCFIQFLIKIFRKILNRLKSKIKSQWISLVSLKFCLLTKLKR